MGNLITRVLDCVLDSRIDLLLHRTVFRKTASHCDTPNRTANIEHSVKKKVGEDKDTHKVCHTVSGPNVPELRARKDKFTIFSGALKTN